MADIEITPANYIQRIKEMTPADRKRLTLKRLIEVILEAPVPDERTRVVDVQLEQLRTMVKTVTDIANQNREEIATLRTENTELKATIGVQTQEIASLKEEIQEMRDENEEDDFATKFEELQDQIDEIEQYLRANNVEMVGLPAPNTGETEETLIINALNITLSKVSLNQFVRKI